MNNFQHEQLFTDLTPEQAAVIEGGAYRLDSIECLVATSDPVGGDEPYINADGRTVWSASMEQGGIENIGAIIQDPNVTLYDDDPWPNPDDPIGSATLDGTGVAYLGGGIGQSSYKLNYSIV